MTPGYLERVLANKGEFKHPFVYYRAVQLAAIDGCLPDQRRLWERAYLDLFGQNDPFKMSFSTLKNETNRLAMPWANTGFRDWLAEVTEQDTRAL